MYHTLNFDNNESKNNHESFAEVVGEMFEENDAKCSDPHDETIIQTRGRRNGRPALLKAGKLGRPSKIYRSGETPRQDPKCLREILVRDDAELRLEAMKNEYTIHYKRIIHGQ